MTQNSTVRGAEGTLRIRPYRPSDRDAIGRICVETGDSGQDATGKFHDDQMLPMVYAYPYLEYAPELCWVVEQTGKVAGYILGAQNVPDLNRWWMENWVPRLLESYPAEVGMDTQSKHLRAMALNPEYMRDDYRCEYPAEFHIDLLPSAQGQGAGRALIEEFTGTLRKHQVPGVAIGVSAQNKNALGFYNRLGFEVLETHSADGEPVGFMLKLDL